MAIWLMNYIFYYWQVIHIYVAVHIGKWLWIEKNSKLFHWALPIANAQMFCGIITLFSSTIHEKKVIICVFCKWNYFSHKHLKQTITIIWINQLFLKATYCEVCPCKLIFHAKVQQPLKIWITHSKSWWKVEFLSHTHTLP